DKMRSILDSPKGCPEGVRDLPPGKSRITMTGFCSCKTGTSAIHGGRPTVTVRPLRLFRSQKKIPMPESMRILLFKCLTMTYSHMGRPHTTIGAEHFHF